MTSVAHYIVNFNIASVATLNLMLIQRGFVLSQALAEDLIFMS
jgi:hypothetical protein